MWKDVLDKPIAQSFLELMTPPSYPTVVNGAIWSIKNNLKFPFYVLTMSTYLKSS